MSRGAPRSPALKAVPSCTSRGRETCKGSISPRGCLPPGPDATSGLTVTFPPSFDTREDAAGASGLVGGNKDDLGAPHGLLRRAAIRDNRLKATAISSGDVDDDSCSHHES
jgi:hypothetical protein